MSNRGKTNPQATDTEVTQYLDLAYVSENADLLSLWKDNSHSFPVLANQVPINTQYYLPRGEDIQCSWQSPLFREMQKLRKRSRIS